MAAIKFYDEITSSNINSITQMASGLTGLLLKIVLVNPTGNNSTFKLYKNNSHLYLYEKLAPGTSKVINLEIPITDEIISFEGDTLGTFITLVFLEN